MSGIIPDLSQRRNGNGTRKDNDFITVGEVKHLLRVTLTQYEMERREQEAYERWESKWYRRLWRTITREKNDGV